MDPFTLAVGALLQPFLTEFAAAGTAALKEGADRVGSKLKAVASRVWNRLLGPDDAEPELRSTAAAAGAVEAKKEEFLSELRRVMDGLGTRDMQYIEGQLREAEVLGGPRHVEAGEFHQDIRGNNNIAIGQSVGDIRIVKS